MISFEVQLIVNPPLLPDQMGFSVCAIRGEASSIIVKARAATNQFGSLFILVLLV